MIIAVPFKVKNERAVQFRRWANGIVKDYTIKGWAMDDIETSEKWWFSAYKKNTSTVLFEQIREIRLSERQDFYQKITDICYSF